MTVLEAQDTPMFPPLLYGEAAHDPMGHAQARAAQGCDAGLIAYDLSPDAMQAAFVFAPDVTLARAMAMLPLCAVGLQNALGALAPPEISVHLDWRGGIRLNGASCGTFHVAASDSDPDAIPDWLIVGFSLPLWPISDNPGDHPDTTSLYGEGCTEVQAPVLLEAWARHTLAWLSTWENDGTKPLHDAWRGLLWNIGKDIEINGETGIFLGVDEDFGLLWRTKDTAALIPLTTLLETTP